ncbi:hypothetical protein [Nannocystis pusilla]|uniref:hypothetical protein n=1 Tax=Nannocystis pusilla TaxID=889268 RepID=UPI003B7F3A65
MVGPGRPRQRVDQCAHQPGLRGARLVELDAPKIILDRECADAQQAFAAMLDLLARPPGDPARAPRPLSGWLPAPLRGEDEDHVPGTLYRFRLAGAPRSATPTTATSTTAPRTAPRSRAPASSPRATAPSSSSATSRCSSTGLRDMSCGPGP